jgi:hypothetical protein
MQGLLSLSHVYAAEVKRTGSPRPLRGISKSYWAHYPGTTIEGHDVDCGQVDRHVSHCRSLSEKESRSAVCTLSTVLQLRMLVRLPGVLGDPTTSHRHNTLSILVQPGMTAP